MGARIDKFVGDLAPYCAAVTAVLVVLAALGIIDLA
jgi:hypothetical protein